jgi:hypothetical protein
MRNQKRIVYVLCVFALLAVVSSCSTPPPLAPPTNASTDRAKAIVQGTSTQDFPATAPGPAPSQQNPNATAQGIVTQQNNAAQSQASASQASSQAAAQPSAQPASMYGAALTPEEQGFLANYLGRLSYMVYYNDASGIDPRFAKMAITQANRYLIEKMGLSVIDFDQIERNKKDQLDAYQTETGGSIDMIQYLAQKFNADVYVEIDLKASASGYTGSYTATAQGTMKLFETSTATLLGSIAFMSPPTFSPASSDSAVSNAIAASVWQAMPKVTEQSKALIAASMTRGIRYELVLQKTPDAKQIGQFVKALSRKLREVEQLNFSSNETKFALYAFIPKAKIQEAIYDAADAALLPDTYLVYMRGKSFTFNTGL